MAVQRPCMNTIVLVFARRAQFPRKSPIFPPRRVRNVKFGVFYGPPPFIVLARIAIANELFILGTHYPVVTQ